jgi:phospholipid-binding lipoprotein MlaA
MNLKGLQVPWRLACMVFAVLLLQGCTSLRGPDPADPLEPMNRKVTEFNDVADDLVLRPVAVIYGEVLAACGQKRHQQFFQQSKRCHVLFQQLGAVEIRRCHEKCGARWHQYHHWSWRHH